MKSFRIFTVLSFILIATTFVFAQNENSQNAVSSKVAVIDSEVFVDEQKGIKELVDANKKLNDEFQSQAEELRSKFEKLKKLEEELKKLDDICKVECSTKLIQEKISEYEALAAKLMESQKAIYIIYEKRKIELTSDINKRIGEAFKQFTKEKGYALIVDISKLNDTFILAKPDNDDLTEEFIKYYNEVFANSKKQ